MEKEQTNKEESHKELLHNFKKIYPIVLMNEKSGMIRIVWKNRTMSFAFKDKDTKAEMDAENLRNGCDEWTGQMEVEMAINNGYHRIRDSENDAYWDVWEAGK